MKKLFACLTFVIVISGIVLATLYLPNSDSVLKTPEVDENYLEEYIKNTIINNYSFVYNVNFSISKEYFDDGKDSMELIALVNLVLKLRLEDTSAHPVILAIEKFAKNNELTEVQKTFLQNYETNYKESIYNCIRNGLNAYIRVKAEYRSGKIELFVETPRGGVYEKAEDALALHSSTEIENESYNALSALVLSISKTGLSGIKYDGEKASRYARDYTSNTSKTCCEGDQTNQDVTFYNDTYEYSVGYDCANYASQSLHAGGIPYDSIWNPSTVAWNYVDFTDSEDEGNDLFSYMLDNYASLSKSKLLAIPGTVALIDWNDNNSPDHAIIIVENDGYTITYSAHTSDRNSAILPNDFENVYYLINR